MSSVKRVKRKVGQGPSPTLQNELREKRTAARSVQQTKEAILSVLSLPTERKKPDFNLGSYLILIYGREKIGKTVLFSDFPNALFFTTEPGTKGMEIYEFNHENGGITDWEIFRRGVDLLVANPSLHRTVIIDTADRAYDMCMDWCCEKMGIEYPGKDASGAEDFGKSWRTVKQEFLKQIHRIVQSGRGIGFTSHAKEDEIKSRSGDRYHRIRPTMGNQARATIEALVDLFFYAEYMKDVNGNVIRVLVTSGDEQVSAGGRRSKGGSLPRFLPLLETGGYDLIERAFNGEEVGLDVDTLLPSRKTSVSGEGLLRQAKVEKSRAKAGSKRRVGGT